MAGLTNMRRLRREDLDSLPPARASLLVEAVLSEKKEAVGQGNPGEEKDEEPASVSVLSKEQLLKIQIKLPDLQDQIGARTQTHLVLVVDNSGSMSGNPWQQVQASVKDIIGHSIAQPNLKTDLIIYADNAHVIDFTAANYETVITNQRAGGMTNFKAAFTKVNRIVSEAGDDYSKTVIVFMTDGADTVNPKEMLPQMPSKLKDRWGEINKDVVIHSVGFTSGHDYKFLKNLSEQGGTTTGMFRYCEPNDDREALKHKLDELFDFILSFDHDKIEIRLTMDGGSNFFLGVDKPSADTVVQGAITPSEAANTNEILVEAEAWIELADPYDLPMITVTVNTVLSLEEGRVPISLPCVIEKTEFNILDQAEDKAHWRLKILSRNVDNFIDRVGKTISENGDVGNFQEKIEKFQKQISHTRVFGNGISKERRQEMFEIIPEIQKNLDQVQNMLASYVRGGTHSIALLARAHDMRYQAVFSKSRRQRIMDKRVSKNMQQASSAQESLSSLIVNEQEVVSLSQDAVGFYFCMLSQNSIQDILLGEDKEDTIGFGLAVKRNEVVLDEPTMIQIWVISGTLVSRTAMLDALEHKINVSSQLSAHGGFDFAKTQLGVTTVGTAREPINAWLPLYVTKSHWDKVKVILKPALGSFCTLDPLGYDYKQMDVMFMTLGSMIGQLRKGSAGEHQLRLLFALLRTCAACLEDFDMTKQVGEFIENFVSGPAGRTKDVIPNLFTLIGYIVAMPTEQSRKIFCLEGDSDSKLPKLWLSLVAEILRRAAGSLYKDTSGNVVKGLLDTILHGTQGILASNQSRAEPAVCRATAEISRLCLNNSNEIQVAAFDPAAGVTVPDIELYHSQKVDRAMEIWAQREAGYVKNVCKTKARQTTDAKKLVQQWVNEGYEQLGIENPQNTKKKIVVLQDGPTASTSKADDVEATTDSLIEERSGAGDGVQSSYDSDHVTGSMLQVLAQLLYKLCHTANPSMLSVPGFIAFVNTWLSKNRNLSEIDNNSGVVPDEWIQEIKAAVTNIYGDLEAFRRESNKQPEKADVIVTEGEGQVNQVQEGHEILLVPDQETIDSQNQIETVINDTVKDDEDGENYDGGLDLYSETDSDDLLEEYLNDDSEDEIAFEARRQMKRERKRQKIFKITVPMILQCIDPDLDVTLVLRGMVCQALRFHRNSDARGAITTTGVFKDLGDGCESATATLTGCHRDLQEYRDTVRKGLLDRALWKRANHCIVHATTVWAFIGYLMNIHKDRGEGFNDLIVDFVTSSETGSVPYLEKKVHVLLTGKYKDCTVFANGNQWLPEKKMAEVFKNLLGEEKWMEYEVELRSAVQIHVYRESDIPNRHGHHNSNPYIPNPLRLKLGMALLPEPKRGARAQRRYLRNAKTS